MKRLIQFFSLTVIVFLFLTATAFAEKVTFEKEYTYQASELDSKASCRTISLEMVKRLLLEELGTYLISETEVKDFKLTKEQIKTYSAGIVGAEIIEDKWDGKTYWLKAKVSADPKEVQKSLKKIIDGKYQAKQLEETRKKAEELTKEVERLKQELANAEGKQPSKKVEQEYKTAIQGLTAVAWSNKGYKAVVAGKHKEALYSYSKVIALMPTNAGAYNNRGNTYSALGNYQWAINDYSKAIELLPDNAFWRVNRGHAYNKIGNHQQAVKDYTKAIELLPDFEDAYYKRGKAYYELGDYKQAISDFKIAARIGDKDAQEFLKMQGIKW